jgi:hypothetical protein
MSCSCAAETRWRPTSVERLRRFVSAAVPCRKNADHGSVINKNIVYSLQYVQYLKKSADDKLPTEVIRTQQIKSQILYVTAIVEATIEYQLRSNYGFEPKKPPRAPDLIKAWREIAAVDIEGLLVQFSGILPVRNRVHLTKHEDNGVSEFRDTSYNFFRRYGFGPPRDLLHAYLESQLFDEAEGRTAILREFDATP